MNLYDFFDEEDYGKAFSSGMEDTAAYIDWYDMFLCAAMEEGADPDAIREELKKGADHLKSRAEASAGLDLPAVYGMGISRAAEEYSLYGFDFFCLLMAVAQEMDGHYREVYKLPYDSASNVEALSFALAESLYALYADDEELSLMRARRGLLLYCPLFSFFPPKEGGGSLFYTFEANRQLAAFLRGDYILDPTLSLICHEKRAYGGSGTDIRRVEFNKLKSILSSGSENDCLVQISGAKGSGKSELILQALDEDAAVLFLSFDRYEEMKKSTDQKLIPDILVRCRLMNETLVVCDIKKDRLASLEVLLELCFRQLDLIFIETEERIAPEIPSCAVYNVELPLPRAGERLQIWDKELGGEKCDERISAAELSGKYQLQPGMIRSIVQDAKKSMLSGGGSRITEDDLTEAVLSRTTTRLDTLCDRIPLKFTWDDLVIDERQRAIMNTLCSRVKSRGCVDEEWGFEDKITYGKGVSMLLYGAPGTGKTMAAQVMARDIGMALYRVDISQLVDKYIGETEKNIGKIFDAASDGNVILFFDEADALFSRRTEVQSSNDKHANTEVAYLLQKIEQHEGVTFLATNRFSDFDSAFVRRLTYAVRLERPDADMRLKLFEKILPEKTPRAGDLDLKFFADSFELSGSEIKEVLYSAAFIALSEDKPLGNAQLARAVKYQQEKTGKLMSGAEFGRYGLLL